MKIWWQSSSPIHRLHDYRRALATQLDSVKRPDTAIRISGVDDGSMDLHFNAVVALNNFGPGGVLNKILQAAEEGYDAVAIGCFLDPAMQEARELVSIPVLGLGETSMLTACMFGHRFSGIAFHEKQAQYYDRRAAEYGLATRHIAFGNLGIDFSRVQDGFAKPEMMTDAFVAEAKRLSALGAEVILAACATVNAIIAREKIREVAGALILDSNAVLLKSAESMAELSHSIGLQCSRRLLYQGPAQSALEQWKRIYGLKSAPVAEPAPQPLTAAV